MNTEQLDGLLDEALDDFAAQELEDQIAQISHATSKRGASEEEEEGKDGDGRAEIENRREQSKAEMGKLLGQFQHKEYGSTLQTTLKSLSHTKDGNETVEDLFRSLSKTYDSNLQSKIMPTNPDDPAQIAVADREVVQTLQMIGSAQGDMKGMEAGKMEEAGESMMESMMAQYEQLAEKEDYNEVIDGVMRQLLSKDLMYEPTSQICEKFPEWLAIHRKNLSPSEYNNYGKLYQSFQKVLAVYDTEPDNFPRLMELMFDMQQYGQPPADIIRDLAPGLKFDENGMPIMPNMGAGMMPEGGAGMMAGGDGLPADMAQISQNMATGQCTVC